MPREALGEDEQREAQRRLDAKLRAVEVAVARSLDSGLWEPTLILLYASIDAMAWLDRPDGQADVHAADFLSWVESYLLPASALTCSGEDLYGARCGFLHSHTGESRRHRELRARKLFYHRRRRGQRPAGIVQLTMNERFLPASVDLDTLAAAFRRATRRYRRELRADASKRGVAYRRILNSYYSEVLFGPGA
jgi:hypothetical protein